MIFVKQWAMNCIQLWRTRGYHQAVKQAEMDSKMATYCDIEVDGNELEETVCSESYASW
jgi:hypothetical protein